MSARYDLIVVGAGMVGATLACALAQGGLDVALVEAREPRDDWPRDSHDVRVSAISAASEAIFRHLDAWPAMVAQRVSPFQEMHVWDAGGSGEIHFSAADLGEARLGHIIENRVIQAALVEQARHSARIDWYCPATVASFRVTDAAVNVELDDATVLSAAVLVGADGGQSRIRKLAAIDTQGWSYRQTALVANVVTERAHRETAWQRFLPDGPLAFLPLSDGRSAIVWSTTPQQAAVLQDMDDADFCAALGKAFDHRLGRILECGERAAFPLQLQHARQYVQPRLALVGDAAHTIHPLAGQGVNLGLLDAAALAEVVGAAHQQGRDIGGLPVLRRYERWRKGDNVVTMGVMDGFKRLFGSELAALRLLRNTGLQVADSITPLKTRLMARAMGLSGDLPRLARILHD